LICREIKKEWHIKQTTEGKKIRSAELKKKFPPHTSSLN